MSRFYILWLVSSGETEKHLGTLAVSDRSWKSRNTRYDMVGVLFCTQSCHRDCLLCTQSLARMALHLLSERWWRWSFHGQQPDL